MENTMAVSVVMGDLQNGCFLVEHSVKMDALGVPGDPHGKYDRIWYGD